MPRNQPGIGESVATQAWCPQSYSNRHQADFKKRRPAYPGEAERFAEQPRRWSLLGACYPTEPHPARVPVPQPGAERTKTSGDDRNQR
jgi:hypothetical protein